MNTNLSPAALTVIRKMQQNELTESVIYEKIAAFAKGEENKQTLLRLAREEKAHYLIWQKYTGLDMKPESFQVFKYTMIARILGFTFAVKLMERGEENAQIEYELLAKEVAESSAIRQQEEEHEHALLAMLDDAGLTEWYNNLENGLDEMIGEKGAKLSAGQRQRLNIIRGILIDKDVYFFDEPTSNLDSESEEKIVSMIDKYLHDKTYIVVTHRDSIKRLCNKHYVFEDHTLCEA
jgi:ABC-type glutathione transport system ATPase component